MMDYHISMKCFLPMRFKNIEKQRSGFLKSIIRYNYVLNVFLSKDN